MASFTTTPPTLDPSDYTLTPIEQQWLITIKQAILDDDIKYYRKNKKTPFEQPVLTDLLWCQLAIVTKGKPKKAVIRMKKLRHLWQEYDFASKTTEEALKFCAEKMPGFTLPCTNDKGNHPVLAMDYSMFLPDKIKTKEDWGYLMYSMVMWCDCVTSTFNEMRKGSVWICQCENLGWKNFSLEMEKKCNDALMDSYPVKHKSMTMVNGGVILNTIIGLCKFFIKKKLADRIRLIGNDDLVVGGAGGEVGEEGREKGESKAAEHARKKGDVEEDFAGCCEFRSMEELPSMFGGTYVCTMREWVEECLERRRVVGVRAAAGVAEEEEVVEEEVVEDEVTL